METVEKKQRFSCCGLTWPNGGVMGLSISWPLTHAAGWDLQGPATFTARTLRSHGGWRVNQGMNESHELGQSCTPSHARLLNCCSLMTHGTIVKTSMIKIPFSPKFYFLLLFLPVESDKIKSLSWPSHTSQRAAVALVPALAVNPRVVAADTHLVSSMVQSGAARAAVCRHLRVYYNHRWLISARGNDQYDWRSNQSDFSNGSYYWEWTPVSLSLSLRVSHVHVFWVSLLITDDKSL